LSSESTRTAAAIQARRGRTEQLVQRVRTTLAQMRRDHMEIDLTAVARHAGVSRTFLYQNAEAKNLLAEAKKAGKTMTPSLNRTRPADPDGPWKNRALNAEDALKAAYAEIGNQRSQIGQLLGQIRDLELDLPADAVERITTENRTLRQQNRKLEADNQQLTERLKAARENNRFLDTRIARLEADLAVFHVAGQEHSHLTDVAHVNTT
jgi:hypothetical protein